MAAVIGKRRGNPVVGAAIAGALAVWGVGIERRQQRLAREGDGRGRTADRPTEIPKRGWLDILKRTWEQMSSDNVSLLAAGCAFYALLSIFPALTATVALYGLVADPHQVQQQVEAMGTFMPPEATKILSDQLQSLVSQPRGGLSVGLAVSVALALWSARAGTGVLMTALNIVYDEKEKRNFIWFNVTAFALTAGLVLFGIRSIMVVAVVPAVLKLLPLPETWKAIIAYVRWPILAALVVLALSILYRFAPSREGARWEWVTPGSIVATLLWLLASAGFSLYVARFSDYNQTYGSLGAVVILLMWFYVTGYAILIGAEINAEMEHQTARDTTPGPEKPMGARGARMADEVAM